MSYRKTHDLCVKTGTYINRDGNEKGQYENVGMILVDGDNKMILVKRTFNPAGVPNPDNKDSVIVSAFAVKERDEKPSKPAPDLDDDLDF